MHHKQIMMKNSIHEGKTIRTLIKRSGIKLTVLSEKLSADTSTICRWYAKPVLHKDIIKRVCQALDEPVQVHFPHLQDTPEVELTREIEEVRNEKIKLLEQANFLQQKIIDLTEDKGNLKDEIIILKNKIIDLTEDLNQYKRSKK